MTSFADDTHLVQYEPNLEGILQLTHISYYIFYLIRTSEISCKYLIFCSIRVSTRVLTDIRIGTVA